MAEKEGWEQDLVNRLAFAALNEQRRTRRWGIFFKLLMFGYLFTLLYLYLPDDLGEAALKGEKHTAVVEIKGLIAADHAANADDIIDSIRKAMEDKNTAGLILKINSPGGSPVQAGYVYDEIMRLRKAHPAIPIYAVASDLCASGGYYIASAADQIYANRASVVGSIGVIMDGFGFVGAMDKLGVERRAYTAGKSKAFLDPFSPAKDNDVKFVHELLENIHQQFISAVKKGRGDRLIVDDDTFSGLMWTGEQAVKRGLVDGLGSARYVAREKIGAEEMVDYTARPDYFARFAERMGTGAASALAHAMDTIRFR